MVLSPFFFFSLFYRINLFLVESEEETDLSEVALLGALFGLLLLFWALTNALTERLGSSLLLRMYVISMNWRLITTYLRGFCDRVIC